VKKLFKIVLFFISITCWSQADNAFWFVAPEISSSLGETPVYLRLTSIRNACDVYITQPANPAFDTIEVHVGYQATQQVDLSPYLAQIENSPENTVLNKGLLIEVDGGDILAYYELDNQYNSEIWTLKGKNALGKLFYVPFQTQWDNETVASSAIDIVAAANGTTVEITPSQNAVGYPAGIPFSVTLDKGETYSVVASGKSGADHLSGTKIEVTAGGDIAVTVKDDGMIKGTRYDMNGDQIVPVQNIGKKYVLGKSHITSGERVFFVATQNGTEIFMNGISAGTINEGGSLGKVLSDTNYYIEATAPVYVYHINGKSNETAGALVPSIDGCMGSTEVNVYRTTSYSNQNFLINIVVRDGAQGAFKIEYEDGSVNSIPEQKFEPVGSTGWYILKKSEREFPTHKAGGIPFDEVTKIYNTKGVFLFENNFGGLSTGYKYGYLSNFSEDRGRSQIIGTGEQSAFLCSSDTVKLYAYGGIGYEWYPQDYLDDPFSPSPSAKLPADSTYIYRVIIERPCWPDTTIYDTITVAPKLEANFSINKADGCAPFSVAIENKSIGVTAGYQWDFNGDSIWDSDTSASFFNTPKLDNQTPGDSNYTIRLQVTNTEGCVEEKSENITVYPLVTAGFSIVDSSGCAPFIVEFDNNSTGDTASFLWMFGDGGTSTKTDPKHAYNNYTNNDSIFDVQLIAESPKYCKDTSEIKQVLVHPYVDVDITSDSLTGCYSHNVVFHNNSVAVDTFNIYFGDGSDTLLTSFNTLQHEYINNDTVPVTYTAVFVGKNNEACVDSAFVNVLVYPEVQASFSMTLTEGCDSVITQLTNNSTGYNLAYQWDFGDNSYSNRINPVHQYTNKTLSIRHDTITLTALSDDVCKDTTRKVFSVFPYVRADFSIDSTFGCPLFQTVIHNQSVGVDTYNWDFDGDGIYDSNEDQDDISTPDYDNPGYSNDTIYTIKLYAENIYGCADSLERKVTVYPSIRADFNIDQLASCHPATFFLTDQAQGAKTYFWSFGDGATSIRKDSISYEYDPNLSAAPEDYTISLFVTGIHDYCTDIKDTIVAVYPYVKADFTTDEYIGCGPFDVSFENSSIGQGNTYEWYVDNTFASNAPTDNAAFDTIFAGSPDPEPVTYPIKLIATNNEGCTDSISDTIAVYPDITPGFTITPGDSSCHPFSVDFTNTSSNATTYLWNFGDGVNSNLENPSHTFNNFGITDTSYVVLLQAMAAICVDSVYDTITVFPIPEARFEVSENVSCPPLEVEITNQSEAGDSFSWSFGDGQDTLLLDKSPLTYHYDNLTNNPVTYNLQLDVSNDNCTASANESITVYPHVTVSFSYDSAGCSPHEANIENNSINASTYQWNFGDGKESTIVNPYHEYINMGGATKIYTVHLEAVSKYQCTDDTSVNITVYSKPATNFLAMPILQYYPNTTINITNKTMNADSFSYVWNYDDENIDTLIGTIDSLQHIYDSWGEYTIDMLAFNEFCSDSFSQAITIFAPLPETEFSASVDTGCAPLTVDFQNKTEYGVSYVWDFNDGNISNEENPEHTFQKGGNYNVKLSAQGHDGGEVSAYFEVIVYKKPFANFTFYPDTVLLPNAQIRCFNHSSDTTNCLWEFGDGESTIIVNPYHTYTDTGDMSIKLTVWTEEMCKDDTVVSGAVDVRPPGVIDFPTAFVPSTTGPSGGRYDPTNTEMLHVFRPVSDNVSEYRLEIYNRWGELLFLSEDINVGWDGYYRNTLCKEDVYIWHATGKYINGNPFDVAGDVTLIRIEQ